MNQELPMDFKNDMANIMRSELRTSDEISAAPLNERWWSSEASCWVNAPEGSVDAAIELERARCISAVSKALADWPHVPSQATTRFAEMVIANIGNMK